MDLTLGTNRFIDCERVLVIDETSVLTLEEAAGGRLLASFKVPSPPARQPVEVRGNEVFAGPVLVESPNNAVVVLMGESTLLSARRAPEGYEVKLDLRPSGLAIYSDDTALHIGGSVLSGNTFRAETGIRLSTK